MSKRHVLQISAYYPPHLGGQEYAVQSLASQLAQAGHTVDVITSAEGGGTQGTTTEGGVKVHRLGGFVFGHAPIMPRFLPTLFKNVRPSSIVHLHIGQAFTPEMVWLASKLRRYRYVAQLHIDFEPSGAAGFLLPLYKRFVLKPVLRGASAVVVLNQKNADTVREFYGYKGPLRILPNGIDDAYFKVSRTDLPKTPPDILKLLYVGRLSKQKNLPTLLHAIATTSRKVQLNIIGDGEELPAIKNLIKTLKLKNVTLHGRLDRKDVLPFYESHDALIMPSLYEAQPLVLLEAMAARIPIIGTNVVGVAEHLQNAAIIVEPTINGLQDGIDQFFTQYQSLGNNIQQGYDAALHMDWPHTISRYQALYDEVAV